MNQNLDKLSQDAKDIIQVIIDDKIPAAVFLPPNCIEVKLDNPVHYLLDGDGGVHFHALGNTEHYLHHRDNPEWAIVFIEKEPIGNADHGRILIKAEESKRGI
jgi:hypothetical protein